MFKDSKLSREHVGIITRLFEGEKQRFFKQKYREKSLETPYLLVTSLVAFCVLISRHIRKAAYFAGKEHVEWAVNQSARLSFGQLLSMT